MSNKERIIELLDTIPDYKIGYVLAYVQGVAADEEADDAFCERMLKSYWEDEESVNDPGTPLDELIEKWGIENV